MKKYQYYFGIRYDDKEKYLLLEILDKVGDNSYFFIYDYLTNKDLASDGC